MCQRAQAAEEDVGKDRPGGTRGVQGAAGERAEGSESRASRGRRTDREEDAARRRAPAADLREAGTGPSPRGILPAGFSVRV